MKLAISPVEENTDILYNISYIGKIILNYHVVYFFSQFGTYDLIVNILVPYGLNHLKKDMKTLNPLIFY